MRELEKSTKDNKLITEAYLNREAGEEVPGQPIPEVGPDSAGARHRMSRQSSESPETAGIQFGHGSYVDDVDTLLQHIESEVDVLSQEADIGVEEGGSSTATIEIIEKIRDLLNNIEGRIPPPA